MRQLAFPFMTCRSTNSHLIFITQFAHAEGIKLEAGSEVRLRNPYLYPIAEGGRLKDFAPNASSLLE
jgi:hypothetical protein